MSAAICLSFFLVGTALLTYCIRGLRQMRRENQHVPAAPDNKAGSNVADLWTCRHVHNATAWTKENR